MTTRKYTSRSQQTTLTSAVTSGAVTIPIASATTLFAGTTLSSGQTFTVVIDPDTALEEIVDVTAVSGNNLTVTRAVDMSGAAAQDHSAGAVVRHMIIGRDLRESNLHIEASTSYNDGTGTHTLHGLGATDGSVVGTDATQTLTNKTLTSPTITNPNISGAGVDASIVFEGTTIDAYETTLTVVDPTQDNTVTLPNTSGTVVLANAAQTLTNKTIDMTGVTLTGLSSTGMVTSSATPKSYVDSILGSATAASTSAASAATSASSAATSASSAATSASSAAASATAAASSATAAASSATAAASSATAAATSASSAATSASAAATSATSASASASAASTSASSAATSASSAATSANSAATSAASAAAYTSAAATSAASAATSATSAANSATAASTSASSAATSASSAAVSAASAAAAVTSAIQASTVDAKGDLIVGTANDTVTRLAIGTDTYILTADSAQSTGMKWAAAPSGYSAPTLGSTLITSGTTVSTITSLTLSNATLTGTLTAASSAGTNGQYLQSTGTGVQWATVQAGSQVKIDGGAAATYDYIDFVGMGTDTATTGTVKVQPLTNTGSNTGRRIFTGTTTPTSPTTGDIWIDATASAGADLTTMVIMGAY